MKGISKFLLITGIAITISCLFLPVASSCRISDGLYDIIDVDIMGYSSFPYYLSLFFLAYITITGFLGKGSGAKTSMIIFTIIGAAVTQFLLQAGKAGWGKPCGNSPTIYQYLLNLGHALILISAYIQLFSSGKNKNPNPELLDEFEE